jgi:uncharacterized Zn finger protein
MADLTEDIVASLAPAEGTIGDARALLRKGAFRGFARSPEGLLVFAECKGSAKDPYKVSLDFSSSSTTPTMRCNCPSRQRPCKHALALALAFVQKGSSFPVGQPPADLVEKSGRLRERKEKQGSVEEKPREVNRTALARKTALQLEALQSLETFLVDLATSGLGGLKTKGIQAMISQANRLGDSDLKGARAQLLHLASLINQAEEEAEPDEDENVPSLRGAALPEDVRHARIVGQFFQLWAMLRKGQRLLDGKAEEGDSKGEDDAMLEALLGRAWKLPELKEAGYWVTGRSLLELAHVRREDTVVEMLTTEGYLLDLGDGSVHVEQTSLPFAAARRPDARLRHARAGVVEVREAALYPGAVNRRVRWSDKEESATERPRAPEDYRKLHALARPLEAATKALKEQLKNPLLGQDAVLLLGAKRFGEARWGGEPVPAMEDSAGQRLLFRDPPGTPFPTSRNLAHAAAAHGPGSVAVRLWYDPVARGIFGQALALFVGEQHLRLGM